MKMTKVIIPVLGILLLSTAASVTGTVAWFSANSTVNASGMMVQATTSEALVIGTEVPVGTAVKVSFGETDPENDAHVLSPATHDNDWTEFAKGLKCLESNTAVDAATGAIPAASESWVPADNEALNTYYVDYVCYIASAGDKMEDKTVTFGFDKATKNLVTSWGSSAENDTLKAFSVDIYMQNVAASSTASAWNDDTFVGTLVLAKSTVTQEMEDMTIPQNGTNTTDGYLRITFRVYLDGDLNKDNTVGGVAQKYVYTDKVNVDAVALGIDINVA